MFLHQKFYIVDVVNKLILHVHFCAARCLKKWQPEIWSAVKITLGNFMNSFINNIHEYNIKKNNADNLYHLFG